MLRQNLRIGAYSGECTKGCFDPLKELLEFLKRNYAHSDVLQTEDFGVAAEFGTYIIRRSKNSAPKTNSYNIMSLWEGLRPC